MQASDVPLARLLRIAASARRGAAQAASGRSSTRACTRSSARRRRTGTASASAGTTAGGTPRVYRSAHPAWNDRNLRELAASPRRSSSRTSAPRPGARSRRRTRTRSATGTGCGCTTALIREFPTVVRELRLAVDPSLYPSIEGTTDSETMFLPRADLRPRGRPARARSSAWSASSRRPAASTGSSTRSR